MKKNKKKFNKPIFNTKEERREALRVIADKRKEKPLLDWEKNYEKISSQELGLALAGKFEIIKNYGKPKSKYSKPKEGYITPNDLDVDIDKYSEIVPDCGGRDPYILYKNPGEIPTYTIDEKFNYYWDYAKTGNGGLIKISDHIYTKVLYPFLEDYLILSGVWLLLNRAGFDPWRKDRAAFWSSSEQFISTLEDLELSKLTKYYDKLKSLIIKILKDFDKISKNNKTLNNNDLIQKFKINEYLNKLTELENHINFLRKFYLKNPTLVVEKTEFNIEKFLLDIENDNFNICNYLSSNCKYVAKLASIYIQAQNYDLYYYWSYYLSQQDFITGKWIKFKKDDYNILDDYSNDYFPDADWSCIVTRIFKKPKLTEKNIIDQKNMVDTWKGLGYFSSRIASGSLSPIYSPEQKYTSYLLRHCYTKPYAFFNQIKEYLSVDDFKAEQRKFAYLKTFVFVEYQECLRWLVQLRQDLEYTLAREYNIWDSEEIEKNYTIRYNNFEEYLLYLSKNKDKLKRKEINRNYGYEKHFILSNLMSGNMSSNDIMYILVYLEIIKR